MKKISVLAAVFVVVSLVAGCATAPSPARLQYEQMELDNMAKVVSGYNLPKQADANSGLVYVVRSSGGGVGVLDPIGVGGLIRFNVFLDDKNDASEMGYNSSFSSQYIYFFVGPGKHAIFSKAEEWTEIHIDVKAGETVFVEQVPVMGLIMARNSLERLPEVKGKYYIKHASLGTIINDGLSKIKKREMNQDIALQPKAESSKINIEKLNKLREGGVISEDEYKRAKGKIAPPQSDTSEINKKIQELSELNKSGVLSEADYNKAKKRLTELQKLNELRQSGTLSEEEYNKAKIRLKEK